MKSILFIFVCVAPATVFGEGTCKSKWEECMDHSSRPTATECDNFIKRRYDCPLPGNSREDQEDVDVDRGNAPPPPPPSSRKQQRLEQFQRKKPVGPLPRQQGRSYYEEEEPEPPVVATRRQPPPVRSRAPPPGDDASSIELDQTKKTVGDGYRSSYAKSYRDRPSSYGSGGGPVGGGAPENDQVRRTDRTRKEKEKIYVKEDLVELDEQGGVAGGEEVVEEDVPVGGGGASTPAGKRKKVIKVKSGGSGSGPSVVKQETVTKENVPPAGTSFGSKVLELQRTLI